MEVDVIQDAFTYVLNNDNSAGMVNEIDIKHDEFWNSDLFDGDCSLIWSPDDLTKSCSRIAKKCHQINEKIRAPLSADILACLKFECNNDIYNETTCHRSLKFSTGFSISVENLFPSGSDSDLLSDSDGDLFLKNSDLSDVEYEGFYDYPNQQKHSVEQQVPYGDDQDQNGCYIVYSNPFDPGLTFDGLTDIFNHSKESRTLQRSNKLNVDANGPPNLLLSFEDPITQTSDYLRDYRKLVSHGHLSHDIPHVTRKPPTRDNRHLEELERLAGRNIDEFDSEQLWLKISDTRHMWPVDALPREDFEPSSAISVKTPDENPTTHGSYGVKQVVAAKPEQECSNIDDDQTEFKIRVNDTGIIPKCWPTVNGFDTTPDKPLDPPKPTHNITNDANSVVEEGTDTVETTGDNVHRISRSCVDQDFTDSEKQKLLMSALFDNPNRHNLEGTSVDGIETDVDAARESADIEHGLAKSQIESSHIGAGTTHLGRCKLTDTVQYMDGSSRPGNMGEQRGSSQPQQAPIERNDQEPLVRFPHDSSMFWKDYGDIDQLTHSDCIQRQPSRPPQDVHHSLLAPIVHHKEYQPTTAQYGSPVLIPHQPHHPVLPQSLLQMVIRPPHQHRFPQVQARAIPRGNRAVPNSSCQQQQQQPPPHKHYHPRPPLVPVNLQVPTPVLQQNQPVVGGHKAAYPHVPQLFPLRHPDIFNVNNAEIKPAILQQFAHNVNNLNVKTRDNQFQYKQPQPNQGNCSNRFEPDLHSLAHEQTHRTNQPEPAFTLPCVNVSGPPFSSAPHMPFIPSSTSVNYTKPSNTTKGEAHPRGHNDPNFRLDDEIWYINGIPHRHARPVHTLQSAMQFYPRRQQSACEANNGGINRRIAEQVAKINQTFHDPPNIFGNPVPKDGTVPLARASTNQCRHEKSNIVNLYPVYSSSDMTETNNVYPCPRNQRNRVNACYNDANNNNNDNNELDGETADAVILRDLDNILASDEVNTCEYPSELELDILGDNNAIENSVTHADFGLNAYNDYTDTGSDIANNDQLELTAPDYVRDVDFNSNYTNESEDLYNIYNDISSYDNGINSGSNHSQTGYSDIMADYVSYSPSSDSSVYSFESDNSPYGDDASWPSRDVHMSLAIDKQAEYTQKIQQQKQQRPPNPNLIEIQTTDLDSDEFTAGIRHIRVLGRNRHQKEKERPVRKRKEVNRKVLVQLV